MLRFVKLHRESAGNQQFYLFNFCDDYTLIDNIIELMHSVWVLFQIRSQVKDK